MTVMGLDASLAEEDLFLDLGTKSPFLEQFVIALQTKLLIYNNMMI
jgi:hypothetical protein